MRIFEKNREKYIFCETSTISKIYEKIVKFDFIARNFYFTVLVKPKQEEEGANRDGNPGQKQQQDPAVGHFYAPHLPGFCEANFCIFHTSGPPS